jgi:hypothetical protein
MQTVKLSENAVAVLRFCIKRYRMPATDRRLDAYRELAAARIMEPVPGSAFEYRFTGEGMEHREAILEREAEGGDPQGARGPTDAGRRVKGRLNMSPGSPQGSTAASADNVR